MKRVRKIFLTGLVFSLFLSPLKSFAEDEGRNERLNELLSGYLAGDLELKKAVLEAQSQSLSLKSTQIKNGISVSLSTGTVSITTDSAGKSVVKVNPELSVEVPELSDAGVSASIPYTSGNGSSYVSGGSVSGTVGIVSSSGKERNVKLLEAERSFTEAKRAVETRALKAEKEFYVKLKKLYNYAIAIHTAKNDLYDDSLDLRVLETQGYSKDSAKYRQALLQVKSDERDVHEQQRLLEKETAVFARKCGIEYKLSSENEDLWIQQEAGENAYMAAVSFLPQFIPEAEAEQIFDYSKENYSEVESAVWGEYLAQLKRDAKNDFSLSATGEYKFNSTQSNYDDAGAKLNFAWKGFSANAGFYVPTGQNLFPENENLSSSKNDRPYFQFGFSVNPNERRLWKIEKQQDKIDEQTEKIALKAAFDDYETDVLDRVSTLNDIKWSKNSYSEQYDMYTQLAADMEKWFKEGSVTESDFNDAVNNREKARFNLMINAIELLIYNNEVKLLFVNDAENSVQNTGN